MTQPRFAAIGFPVADMARSLEFYRALGLDVPDGAEDAPHVEIELAPGVKLLLDTHATIASFDPGFTPPEESGANLAFDCGDPAGVDELYEKLTAAGYESHLAPWDAFWGQRYAVVLGPDGNGVDLYAALPAS
ncbi:VOC family protein [Jiangella mangrovi]|uniref:Catechol 2,3-dioxygenase-like lactoylglutathione lyase family enzyme n=1 Tax=Jiangella mangrovi TaxID=1524084 RepID=A0A7W9LJW3_9ACTN|nr:VOC family protein [Jiangella mangrovi]MBB5786464.1 catechol 2,3-dioxygenase-like lactoylglutathione lyase family enzyme [Jiangella mangrovi]